MVESKIDDPSATGTHRAWAGETAGTVGGTTVRASTPRDVQRNWLDRSQPANPRHGAITRTLYNWNSYKSWTDRVKGSFDKERDKDKKPK
jgi:hypothetical protein